MQHACGLLWKNLVDPFGELVYKSALPKYVHFLSQK